MQMLHPSEVDVPTYHFMVQKNHEIASTMVMFREPYNLTNHVGPSTIVLIGETFPHICHETQMKTICKSYTPEKLMYQLTTMGVTKILEFHIICS